MCCENATAMSEERLGRGAWAGAVAALLCACHSIEIGPAPHSVQPREFRILIHTDADMTDAIVEQQGGDVSGSDQAKRDLVMPYLEALLDQVNAIYRRNLGVSFFFHDAERDWIDTGVSPFGACGHYGAAIWNNALVDDMEDLPDLATMLVHCPNDPSNSRGYSHWNGLCSGGRAESVVATGRAIDDPEIPRMVAHELGHLMGASHTFGITHVYTNGDRHFEPGCGSTLMSYGGGMVDNEECEPSENFVHLTDDYFHAYSIGEMQREIADEIGRGKCGRLTHPDEHTAAPSLNLLMPPSATIPAGTPFILSAAFGPAPEDRDVTGFDVSFDEIDDDGSESLLGDDQGSNSIIRSRIFRDLPAQGGHLARHVPSIGDVARGVFPRTETPSSGTRSLKFRVMARALHSYGASTEADDMRLRVRETGRPFGKLGYPAEVMAGEGIALSWDPAGTDRDTAFNARSVRFRLCITSCEGPDDFAIDLVDGQGRSLFPNTGSATAFLPPDRREAFAQHGRILVENEGETFFDVGRAELAIRPR